MNHVLLYNSLFGSPSAAWLLAIAGGLSILVGCQPSTPGGPQQREAVAAIQAMVTVDVEYDEQGALTTLRANSSGMTDQAAAHLSKLTSLRRLDLGGSGVTDEALKSIGKLTGLTALSLERTEVTSAGIAELASCLNLEELMLAECPVDDEAIATISELKALKLLDLSQTKITDTGLSSLAPLTNLHTLYLRKLAISGNGMEAFKSSPEIELLDISGITIDPQVIETLSSFPVLGRLYLGETNLNDDLLPQLVDTLVRSNPRLRGLAFPKVPLTDASIEPLKRLKQLGELALVDMRHTKITVDAYQDLTQDVTEVNFTAHYPVD